MGDQQGVSQTMWYMVCTAKLVCHRVADAQERIGECHASDGGGVVHLLTGNGVCCAVLVGAGEVLEAQLDGLQGQTCTAVERNQ